MSPTANEPLNFSSLNTAGKRNTRYRYMPAEAVRFPATVTEKKEDPPVVFATRFVRPSISRLKVRLVLRRVSHGSEENIELLPRQRGLFSRRLRGRRYLLAHRILRDLRSRKYHCPRYLSASRSRFAGASDPSLEIEGMRGERSRPWIKNRTRRRAKTDVYSVSISSRKTGVTRGNIYQVPATHSSG